MGWETLTLSVFSVATLQYSKDNSIGKDQQPHNTDISFHGHVPHFSVWAFKTNLKGGNIKQHWLSNFISWQKECPGLLIYTSAISEGSLFRGRCLNQNLVPGDSLYSSAGRQRADLSLEILQVPPTHFVSDGLKVRSEASKFHISVLITFQLGALENTKREFPLETCMFCPLPRPFQVVIAT